jgi:hypothetical protein
VHAHSPQAKARIEWLWPTLQDRLVSELRLHDIRTCRAANAFLPTFLADFNPRFVRAAADPQPVWRRPPADLAAVLSCRYQRVVGRDNTVRLGPRLIQIRPGPLAAAMRSAGWTCASCSTAGSSCARMPA